LRDVGGLGMKQDLDLCISPVKSLLLIADAFDRAARRGLDRVLAIAAPRTSPAMTTRLVVAKVSQATRV